VEQASFTWTELIFYQSRAELAAPYMPAMESDGPEDDDYESTRTQAPIVAQAGCRVRTHLDIGCCGGVESKLMSA
jgi:hypothetical protein